MIDLDSLSVPGPTQIALTEPFWTAAEAGKLSIQQCTSCCRAVFYPRPICPHCWQDALKWIEASGSGTLKSYSEIWKPGHHGWVPAAPYIVGLVELAEGPTMLSHIFAESNAALIGAAVRFTPAKIGGRILPCFELT